LRLPANRRHDDTVFPVRKALGRRLPRQVNVGKFGSAGGDPIKASKLQRARNSLQSGNRFARNFRAYNQSP
jgi:hypothetical protein